MDLRDELLDGAYAPGRSICFVVTRPKAREIWAADFRDRVVHHLLYNKCAPRFHASFLADTCACIPGRGTLYAARRLEGHIRSISQNWSRPAFYLKCDLANYFVSIDKNRVFEQLERKITEPWWLDLARTILMHDPRLNFEWRGPADKINLVPPHKRLGNQPAHIGLPMGNLSSQWFSNIYRNVLDQYVKHRIGAKYYINYVDDFMLLHESSAWLSAALREIDAFLPATLGVRLNHSKTIIQPVSRGVDFVGHVIKPWCTRTRRRTLNEAISRVNSMPSEDVYQSANSYFGLLRQSTHSHADQARFAKAVLRRGHCVSGDLTKAYRKAIK